MTNRNLIRWLVLPFILAIPFIANGQDFATDLNGFRLWQFTSVVKAHFGNSFDSRKGEGTIIEAFRVTDKSYMVFERMQKRPENIFSIQITGYPTVMKPFRGLVLGDPATKVAGVLGRPSRTKSLKEPPVTAHYYDNANYTIEIDSDNRLYSIRISVSNDFMNKAELNFEVWNQFKKAVLAKDMTTILELVRPDVEIYKSGDVLAIKERYDDFCAKPDDKFANALFGERNSVYEELKKTEPEGEMRVAENVGVGQVFKFYKGQILKEIVFFPYAGKYRVYEIAFREDGGVTKKEAK